ncbi:MAG: hypothetical protein HY650_01690 [Acidobacteria bacterium]|nr:hypothetical protein [Acidobacteriota bacterium]
MKTRLSMLAMVLLAAVSVSAQSEARLKQYFEGRQVTLKIDMPATKDGVNVRTDRDQPFDYGEYGNRIKRYGKSIRVGESVMVTKIKVTGRHIEFQLGGGGYGTFLDESAGPVAVPPAEKSRREKELDRQINETNDQRERRRLEQRREELRRERREEDQRNQRRAQEERERREARIERKALEAGSRFNIYFAAGRVSDALTPEWVMQALEEFIEAK